MRRTLAIGLAAAVLLTGGCARQQHAADKPAATSPAAERRATSATTGTAKAGSTTPADVDGLLDEIDKQLAGDSQPSEDQD